MIDDNNWFGQVRTRPLSVFRIAFGLLLLKVAVYYLALGTIFYSDAGVSPLAAVVENYPFRRVSIMHLLTEPWQVTTFFILYILIVICVLVGYKTRFASILNFVFLLSIHVRNPYLLDSADDLMRLLSLWMIFIPLADYFSVDAWLAQRKNPEDTTIPKTTYAFPVRIIQFQVLIVYLFTGIFKLMGPVWRRGEGVWYALQLETLLQPSGALFFELSPLWVLQALSWFTVIVEVTLPFMLIAPFFQPHLKAIGILLGTMLHVGIAVLMSIPNFFPLMVISYLLFVEDSWISWVLSKLGIRPGRYAVAVPNLPPEDDAMPAAIALKRGTLTVTLAFLMGVIMWWSFSRLEPRGEPLIELPPQEVRVAMHVAGINQLWRMFSPTPTHTSTWISAVGTTSNGNLLDLRTGETLRSLADSSTQDYHFGPNIRWMKYEENLRRNEPEPLLQAMADYYCEQYRDALENEDELEAVHLILIGKPAMLTNGTTPPPFRRALSVDACP